MPAAYVADLDWNALRKECKDRGLGAGGYAFYNHSINPRGVHGQPEAALTCLSRLLCCSLKDDIL